MTLRLLPCLLRSGDVVSETSLRAQLLTHYVKVGRRIIPHKALAWLVWLQAYLAAAACMLALWSCSPTHHVQGGGWRQTSL